MGKCTLNKETGLEQLRKAGSALTSYNLHAVLAEGAASYIDGMQYLSEYYKSEEGNAEISDFLRTTIDSYLIGSATFSSIKKSDRVEMTNIISDTAVFEVFKNDWYSTISGAAIEVQSGKEEEPVDYIDVMSYGERVRQSVQDISMSNGADSEIGTGVYPDATYIDFGLGNELELYRQSQTKTVEFEVEQKYRPRNNKVISPLALLKRDFENIKKYYTAGFVSLMQTTFMDNFMDGVLNSVHGVIDPTKVVDGAISDLIKIAESISFSETKVREGKGTIQENQAYYATIALRNMETVLHNNIQYIIADQDGKYIINLEKSKAKKNFGISGGAIDGHQMSKMMDGILQSTENLVPVESSKQADGTDRMVYKIKSESPTFTKESIIFLSQYINQAMVKYVQEEGKLPTRNFLRDTFSTPKIDAEEGYQMAHSLVVKLFNDQTYLVKNEITGSIKEKKGFSRAYGNDLEAKKIIDNIQTSISSQVKSTGINSKSVIAQRVTSIKSGQKTASMEELETMLAESLIDTKAKNKYKISSSTLKVSKAADDAPYEYSVDLQLSKRSKMSLTFKGNMSTNASNLGIQPTADTLKEMHKLFSNNKKLLIKAMTTLKMPHYMTTLEFLNKYESTTVGNTVADNVKFEYFFSNLVFMLAMNIPSNKAELNSIAPGVIPSTENITSYYSSMVQQGVNDRSPEVSDAVGLEFNPFTALYHATNVIDTTLVAIYGKTSTSLFRDVGAGWEYGVTPKSAAKEIKIAQERGKLFGLASGITVPGYSISSENAVITRGATKDGDVIKSVDSFNSQEHLSSIINGPFLGMLLRSNGNEAGFGTGSATDTSRPAHIVMSSEEGFIVSNSDQAGKDRLEAKAVQYHIKYYTHLKNQTLNNWKEFLADNSHRNYDSVIIAEATKSLKALTEFLKQESIPLEIVASKMVSQMDYVKYGKSVIIKPEYTYLAEDVFNTSTFSKGLSYLKEKFEGKEITTTQGNKKKVGGFMQSEAYKKFSVNATNGQYIKDVLGRNKMSPTALKMVAGYSYYWHETMFKNMFRRASVGDVINFKGSIDRSNIEAQYSRLEGLEEYKDLSFKEKHEALEQLLIEASLSNMMVDQAKRASSVDTGSARVEVKEVNDKGSYLQSYNPVTGEGGINSVTFEELSVGSRDILGAMKDAGIDDIYDGVQWGHPLLFFQFNNGMMDSNRSIGGSAFKLTAMENDGYSSRLQKNSVQDVLTYENLRKSDTLRWLMKVANTKVTFREDGQSIKLQLPKVIVMDTIVDGKPNTEFAIKSTGAFELMTVDVANMQDLYEYFGAELGGNIYNGMTSWDFIHTYILSGENYPDGTNAGIENSMTNKYVGIIGTTSSQKMGNKNINSASKMDPNTSIDSIEVNKIDPFNYGSILNASEDIGSSDNDESSHVKMSTQIMRTIKLGGNNMHEAEVVHTTKALLADKAYEQYVTDNIESLSVGILIEEADKADSKLPENVRLETQEFLQSISGNNRPNGMTSEDYDVLMELVSKAGPSLEYLGTKRFFSQIVEESLRHIDHEQTVLDAYKEGNLDLNSKQIKNIVTSAFYSEVSKKTVKQAFKGSHTVLGPSHGIIPLYEVSLPNGISIVLSADDYAKNDYTEFRGIGSDPEQYAHMLTFSTLVQYKDVQGNTIKSTIGSMAYKNSQLIGIDLSTAYRSLVAEMLHPDSVAAEEFKFKIPDINRKRDLKYSEYSMKVFNPDTGQVEISPNIDPNTLRVLGSYSIYNTDEYKQLQKLREDKAIRNKEAASGTLYEGAFSESNIYKPSRPIAQSQTFAATTAKEAKQLAMDYVEGLSGLIKENTLFKLNGTIYVYNNGTLKTYKQRYKASYQDHTKYSKGQFNAYMSLTGRVDLTYEQYLTRTSVENDLNDDIYDSLIQARQRDTQQLLNQEIHYADVELESGVDARVEILDIFNNQAEMRDISDKLEPGYYIVGTGDNQTIINLTQGGEDATLIELHTEHRWNFEPTEIIMTPHYMKEYFMEKGMTIMDFIGGVDYSDLSRADTLMKYERGKADGSFHEYIQTKEYEYLKDLFKEKLKAETQRGGGLFKIFKSPSVSKMRASDDAVRIFEEEVRRVKALIPANLDYEKELSLRLSAAMAAKEELELLAREELLTPEKMNEIKGIYVSELNSLSREFEMEGARNRALSWNTAHEVFFTRIPSQDKQSYNRGRIVNYSFESNNTVLTPADLIRISGADYDIDKLFNMIYNINSRGKLEFFADLKYDGLISEDGIINPEILDEYVASKMEAYKSSLSLIGVGQAVAFHNRMASYKKKIYKEITHVAHNHLVKSLMDIISDPRNFKQATTLIGIDHLEKLRDSLNISSDTFDPFDLISDIQLDIHGMSGKGMIGVVANALKNYSLVYNAAKKTQLSVDKFAPKNYIDTYQAKLKGKILSTLEEGNPELHKALTQENPDGLFTLIMKEQVGIDEDTDKPIMESKVYHSKVVADGEISTDAFHTEYKRVQDFKRRLKSDPNTAISETVNYLKELQSEEGFRVDALKTKTETWELFSELLTAATDNAKLMIISELGIDYTSLNIVHTLLTMGYDLEVGFKFIGQKQIKDALKQVKNSVTVLNVPGKTNKRTSLRKILGRYARKNGGYDMSTFKVTSLTKAFNATKGKSKFEEGVDKGNVDLSTARAELELSHPFTQLLNILDIQDSLTIVRSMAKATQGLDSDPFVMYSELNRIEYQIKKRLSGRTLEDENGKQEDIDNIDFDIYRFFNDSGYRKEQIDSLGETAIPGYNFLEIIAQNTDVFAYKQIQVRAKERVNIIQQVDLAAEKVSSFMKKTGKTTFFEEKSNYISYENIVDELTVASYFDERKDKYKYITIPGVEGQTFNLTDPQGRYDFLVAMEEFYTYIQDRAASDSTTDASYSDNMFLNTLGLSSNSYGTDDENAPKYFQSTDIRNFKLEQVSMIDDGYNALDGADQRVFELYSLLVNKSTKSVKTFESFMDFGFLREYNAYKTSVLQTPGKFEELLNQVSPTQLVLNSRNSVRIIPTKSFPRQIEGMEDVYTNIYSKSLYMRMPEAMPGESTYDNGVDLFKSETSNQLYASVASFKDLLAPTNGWFPIEKVLGYSSISYDTITGKYAKGLKAILASGASPLPVTYKLAGSDETVEGYVLGMGEDSNYVLLDENYQYDGINSKANTIDTMIELNRDMEFEGTYIGRKPLYQRSIGIDETGLENEEINKSNIDHFITYRPSLFKEVITGGVNKFVSPVSIKGDVHIGQQVHMKPYKGGLVVFRYLGEEKIVDDGSFDKRDIRDYSNYHTKDNAYTVFGVEVIKDPKATAYVAPKDFNRGFADEIDTDKFQSAVKGGSGSIVWGHSTIAGIPKFEAMGISKSRTLTVLKSRGKSGEFTRDYLGDFNNPGDIIDELIKRGYPVPDGGKEREDFLINLFGVDTSNNYKSPLKSLLQGAKETVSLFSLLPFNVVYRAYQRTADLVNKASDLNISEDFNLYMEGNNSGKTNIVEQLSDTNMSKNQINLIDFSDSRAQATIDATLANVADNYNQTVSKENQIEIEKLKNKTDQLFSSGIDLKRGTAVVLKVPEIVTTISKVKQGDPNISKDAYNGIPSKYEAEALRLLYLKERVGGYRNDIPLFVFNDKLQIFQEYNFTTGEFGPVIDGIPQVGKAPLMVGFKTGDSDTGDIGVINSLIRYQAYTDAVYSQSDNVNNKRDQYLINLAEEPTEELTKVRESNTGDSPVSALGQLRGVPGFTTYREKLSTETMPGPGEGFLATDELGQPAAEVDGKFIPLAGNFDTIVDEGNTDKFRVKTYAADGSILIEVIKSAYAGGQDMITTYAVFPNEEQRVTEYGNFTGLTEVSNITGTLLDKEGRSIPFSLDKAFLTTEAYMLRRDQNAEIRTEVYASKVESRRIYVEEVQATFKEMAKSSGFKAYMKEMGGTDALYKIISQNATGDLLNRFPSLGGINTAGDNLLEQFKLAFMKYDVARDHTKVLKQDHIKANRLKAGTKVATIAGKDPFTESIDKSKEGVLLFSDSNMGTNDALRAEKAILSERSHFKNVSRFTTTASGDMMGGFLLNVFNSGKNGITFLKGKERPGDSEVSRTIKALQTLERSSLEKTYIHFPDLSDNIAEDSVIKYSDLADLLVRSFDKMGYIPKGFEFSENLASYITSNTGVFSIGNIKMDRAIVPSYDQTISNAIALERYLPDRLMMGGDKTLLEILNIRKGLKPNNLDITAKSKEGSFLGKKADTKKAMKDVYADWLRSNPGKFIELMKVTKYHNVLINKFNSPIEQLIEAMNEIGFNVDIATEITKDLGLTNVSQSGVSYKVMSKEELYAKDISTDIGSRVKTTVDDITFVAEVVGDRNTFLTKVSGIEVTSDLLLDSMDIDDTVVDALKSSKGGDMIVVKVYRDPSASIITSTLSQVRNSPLGNMVSSELEAEGMELSGMDTETLNRGTFALVFDITSSFGEVGVSSIGGNHKFNRVANALGGNVLYTEGLEDDMVVSMLGTNFLDVISDNKGQVIKPSNENDIKNYFNLVVKKVLDSYIIPNRLGVAVGNKAGMDQQIMDYMLSKPDYGVNSLGDIVYQPTTSIIKPEFTKKVIVSNNARTINMVNAGRTYDPINGMLASPLTVNKEDTESKWVTEEIRGTLTKGKSNEYSYAGSLDAAALHGEVKNPDIFYKEYNGLVKDEIAPLDLTRNNEFITQVVTGIATGQVDGKITNKVTDLLGRVMDEEGNLLIRNSKTGETRVAHPMVSYAVAKNKYAALMLLRNNLEFEMNVSKITSFIKDAIDSDKYSKKFRDLYGPGKISVKELEDISNSDNLTNFELMLYDITTSNTGNLNQDLVPSQNFFYSKLIDQGIGSFKTTLQNTRMDSPAEVEYVFNTGELYENGEITSPKYDSDIERSYLNLNDSEAKVKAYKTSLYWYVKRGSIANYRMDSTGITVDGTEVTPKELHHKVKFDILQEMFDELKIETTTGHINEMINSNEFNKRLNIHMKYSVSGVSLLNSMFTKNATVGLRTVNADVHGEIVNAPQIGKTGMLLNSGKGIIFVAKTGEVYDVSVSPVGDLTFEVNIDKRIALVGLTDREGNARYSKAGDVYSSLVVDGEQVNDSVKLVQSNNSGKLIAESVITGDYYSFVSGTDGWSKVELGADTTDPLFVAQQKPEHINQHTTQIVADSMLYDITVKEVSGNTITTLEGWTFEYSDDTELFTLTRTADKKLPVGTSVNFQKADVVYPSNIGYNTESVDTGTKTLGKIVNQLSTNLGINVEMLSQAEILEEYGDAYAIAKGFTFGAKVIVNSTLATLDTPMHEFGHFYFRHLKTSNYDSFLKLKRAALDSDLAMEIRSKYPELGTDTDELAEEILTTMLGKENERQVLETAEKGILKRILATFKEWFNGMFGVKSKEYEIDFDTNLSGIMESIGTQLLYGPRSILNGTPKGEKSYLSKIMNKVMPEKDAITLLQDRGFIVEVC